MAQRYCNVTLRAVTVWIVCQTSLVNVILIVLRPVYECFMSCHVTSSHRIQVLLQYECFCFQEHPTRKVIEVTS